MILHGMRIFYGLLLASGMGGVWLMGPEDPDLLAGTLLSVGIYLPVLAFLPAVVRGDPRQLTWLCFILMFYFCGFVVQAFYPPPMRWLALVRLTFLTGFFALAVAAIRQGRSR